MHQNKLIYGWHAIAALLGFCSASYVFLLLGFGATLAGQLQPLFSIGLTLFLFAAVAASAIPANTFSTETLYFYTLLQALVYAVTSPVLYMYSKQDPTQLAYALLFLSGFFAGRQLKMAAQLIPKQVKHPFIGIVFGLATGGLPYLSGSASYFQLGATLVLLQTLIFVLSTSIFGSYSKLSRRATLSISSAVSIAAIITYVQTPAIQQRLEFILFQLDF